MTETSDGERKDELQRQRRERQGKRLREILSGAFDKIKSALFPEDITCDLCGEELVAATRYNICSECLAKLPVISGHICRECGTPIADEADYCNRCQNSQYQFVNNRSALVYDGDAKNLIYQLKFGRKKYIAKTLAAFMVDTYLNNGGGSDIVVFVPMTVDEERKRGFNQSELIARSFADRLKMPMLPALIKKIDTPQQKLLTRDERELNLQNAFACVFNEVKGRNILLIDDVFTTGATANACTNVLLKAGAKEVRVLTAAITKLKVQMEVDGDKAEESKDVDAEQKQ